MKRHANPSSILEFLQQLEHRSLHRDIERARRLVSDQKLRVHGQRTRDADALLLTARQLVRVSVAVVLRKTDAVEQSLDSLVELIAFRLAGEEQRLTDRLTDRKPGVE